MATTDETKELVMGYRAAAAKIPCGRSRSPARVDFQWWAAQGLNDTALVTSGNKITPLIDGQKAMQEIYNEFLDAKYYILLTGWDIDIDAPLLGPNQPDSTLIKLLEQIVNDPGRLVKFRLVLWERESSDLLGKTSFLVKDSPRNIYRQALRLEHASIPKQASPIMTEDGTRPDYRCKTIVYDQTRLAGSLHQKTAVVDGRVAFCGGIDLAKWRWAPSNHEGKYNWHDVHAKIEGPAVRSIQENFVRRWKAEASDWTDDAVLKQAALNDAELRRLRAWERDKSLDLTLRDSAGLPGSLDAQVIRSIHAASDSDIEDHSYLESCARAIINARHYIYIENQFFNCPFLAGLLLDRLRAMRSLHLIVLMPYPELLEQGWLVDLFPGHKILDLDQLSALAREDPHRVTIAKRCTPEGYPLFVHAKVMIVDDVYASIGSSNFTVRSFETVDEELGIAWMDRPGGSVTEFRKALWSEHLGLKTDDPALIQPSGAGLMKLWLRALSDKVQDFFSKD